MESEIYLWATTDLADNVMAKINLKFENDFGTAPSSDGATEGNVDLWEGYVKLAKMYDSPISLVVGRWVAEVNRKVPSLLYRNTAKVSSFRIIHRLMESKPSGTTKISTLISWLSS